MSAAMYPLRGKVFVRVDGRRHQEPNPSKAKPPSFKVRSYFTQVR